MPVVTVQLDGSSKSTTVNVASGAVIWKADASLPIDQEWAEYSTPTHCTALTNAVTSDPNAFQQSVVVAKGARAYEFVLTQGDTSCYGARTEIGQGLPERPGFSESRRFNEGDDRWISFQFMLGNDWNTTTPLWNGFGQLKQNISSSVVPFPMIGIGCWNGNFEIVMEDAPNDPNPNHTKGFFLGPAVTGRWIKHTWHVVFSINPAIGLMEVFGDPDGKGMRTLMPLQHTATLAEDASGNSVPSNTRIGIYRHGSIPGTAHLYYDSYTVATTRAAAEANAF